MRKTTTPYRTVRALLLANGCLALITGSGALVVLLIAPLGLAGVISCTLLVALLSFCAGLAADVVLLRVLLVNGSVTGLDQPSGPVLKDRRLHLFRRRQERLPQRP